MSSDVLKKLEAHIATTDTDADAKEERKADASNTGKARNGPDENIQQYLREVTDTPYSLLEVVREDTGESGKKRGNRWDFHKDPVSGHKDSFSVYRGGDGLETWTCYSASNTGRDKGTLLEYLEDVRGYSKSEAVKYLLDATGHQPIKEGGKGKDVGKPASTAKDTTGDLLLPRWDAVHAADPPERAPALIDGMLRCGHVGLISGKAKAGKSWAALQLAVAVATGGEWLGRFRCKRGKVLYIDPELDRRSLEWRVHRVCEATGASYDEVEARVSKWCLRGTVTTKGEPPTIRDLAHDLSKAGERFDLIIFDSASCFLEGDENSSHDVRALTIQVNRICEKTGAAALIVTHMGKGLAGDREAADRHRGSSVWADAPDVTMTVTETLPPSGEPSDHLAEGERALLLECAGIREFPLIDPVRLIYGYPVHRLDADGITDGWKPATSTGRGGKASGNTRKMQADIKCARCEAILLAHFLHSGTGREGIPAKEAADLCSAELEGSITSTTLKTYFEESELIGVYQKSPRRAVFYPKRLPPKQADISDVDPIQFSD